MEIGAVSNVPIQHIAASSIRKMKSLKVIIITITCIAIISCINRNNSDNAVVEDSTDSTLGISFDLESLIGNKSNDSLFLNTVAKNISFTPLETIQESLFLNFNYNLAKIENFYFITGGIGNSVKGILQFDTTGNYIQEIVRQGRGPNELPYITSWYASEPSQKVMAMGNDKIIIHSINNKTSSIQLDPEIGFHIVPLSDNSYVSCKILGMGNNDSPHLIFFDKKGSDLKKIHYPNKREVDYNLKETQEDLMPLENYILLPNYEGNALFQDVYNDTIFLIKSYSDISPHIILKRGKYSPKFEDIYNVERKRKQIYFRQFFETERYFFLKYIYNKKIHTTILDKKDHKIIGTTDLELTFSNLTKSMFAYYKTPNGNTILINIVYATSDKIYCLIESYYAMEFVPGVQKDDNPVVMIISL